MYNLLLSIVILQIKLKCLLMISTMLQKNILVQWRRGGLVVRALDSRSGGRWFETSHCHRVVSLDEELYSTLSLFTQVYNWVPAIIMLGSNLAMD